VTLAMAAVAATAPPEKPPAPHMTVAVLPFEGSDEQLASQVTDLLSACLSSDSGVDLVERAKLAEVLEEQGLGRAGLVDPATAQRVGYLVGARVLILGRTFEMDRKTYIVGRLVGVETGRVIVRLVSDPVGDSVAPLVKGLASTLATELKSSASLLVAPDISANRQQALEKLIASVGGKRKPGVVVDISETHYGRQAVDPAAETELLVWLKEAGFPVFEPEAAMPATDKLPSDVSVIILGEAFSEAAGSFGRFQIAKIRIEVRAVDRKSGEVIATLRRVGTAAELSERAAAKKGLADEAANIAYELIPKLVEYQAPSS
jgi:hypothetical protein